MPRVRLQSISINGYKSFASLPEKQALSFGDVTLVIGANGSGKSNLVSFFRLLNEIANGSLQVYIGLQGFANNMLHFGVKTSPQMSAELVFADGTDTDTYGFTLSHAGVDDMIFTREYIMRRIGGEYGPYDVMLGTKESAFFDQPAQDSYLGQASLAVKGMLKSSRAYQFHDTSTSSRMRNQSYVANDASLYSDGGNLAAYLRALKLTPDYRKYYDRIVRYIQDIMPQFGDFVLEPSSLNPEFVSLNWRVKGENEYLFGPQQLSDGSLRFMALATLLLQPGEKLPGLVVIDEPELGLHPSAIQALAGMVKMASAHCQVILATQSPQLVDCFDASEIMVVEMDEVKRSTVCKRLDQDRLVEWLHDYSLSELWEKNVLGGQP